ncbi:3-keto-5-aminohexanoate cleavage enzyme [Anaerobranca californiensis DSM 14826]|jgi:3-keto-5-aminohexanoate cleavage enzyme|uniref:3-keto-5-aminohexanoate cleavage enzyme n=1 Tax=Anaerobranca californiensis DSM 14826 TaxID=1120989 RepID=A0A1M6MAN7_9FIRM|nr:3-keto-5-aminohexanoate cleavage protein [Anaerobranca californiensis]SHJ80494.1 3-keto-5-aminohexanoate cleavage enzyme [Anaerobranca californiensis DSM 14826]
MQPLIITAALVGAEVTKEQNPNLPITPEEIAQSAYECYQKGASIIHLHVRDKEGKPTQSVEIFKETIDLIKKKCDPIIQISTGGAVGTPVEERIAPLALRPEMATLTTGTVNFGNDVFMNTPQDLVAFARAMKEYGVKPEIEVFEGGMINNALTLVKRGLLDLPLHFDFVLGVPGALTAGIEELLFLKNMLPQGSTWTVAGIGRHELPLANYAILLGGHVRVGFEDNIYYEKGVLAKSNAQLVERIVTLAKILSRPVATVEEARQILNLRR